MPVLKSELLCLVVNAESGKRSRRQGWEILGKSSRVALREELCCRFPVILYVNPQTKPKKSWIQYGTLVSTIRDLSRESINKSGDSLVYSRLEQKKRNIEILQQLRL